MKTKVKEVMTKNVVTVSENDNIRSVVLKMRKKGITGVPVMDQAGEVLGVFSETDMLNQLPDILNDADKIPLIDVQELTNPPVKNVMGKPPLTVGPDDMLKDVAKIILENYIHRLPVLENGKLVGIVSLGDLLKSYIEHEG